jgi:hypothetical protein
MLSRIFPRQFDNDYRGNRLAIWLLVPILLMRLVMGTNSIVLTRLVASSADGIPLGSFSPAGQETVLFLFAVQGLCMVLIVLLGILALVRYRAMIPLIYLMLLAVQLGSKALLLLHPVARTAEYGASPLGFYINLGLLAAAALGFVLSLLGGARERAPA